jgi:hypothetical protein
MKFDILEKNSLSDGSRRYIINVDEAEKLYLGYFLESFENLCIYSSYKKDNKKVFYIDVPPDLISFSEKLLNFLKDWQL